MNEYTIGEDNEYRQLIWGLSEDVAEEVASTLQHVRQEAARECYELALQPLSTIKPCCLITANEIADKIKAKFKLEE